MEESVRDTIFAVLNCMQRRLKKTMEINLGSQMSCPRFDSGSPRTHVCAIHICSIFPHTLFVWCTNIIHFQSYTFISFRNVMIIQESGSDLDPLFYILCLLDRASL